MFIRVLKLSLCRTDEESCVMKSFEVRIKLFFFSLIMTSAGLNFAFCVDVIEPDSIPHPKILFLYNGNFMDAQTLLSLAPKQMQIKPLEIQAVIPMKGLIRLPASQLKFLPLPWCLRGIKMPLLTQLASTRIPLLRSWCNGHSQEMQSLVM